MTPKEKAEDLFNFYLDYCDGQIHWVKECSLKVVNEIIDELTSRGILSGFWYEVHQEIKKL